MESQVDPGCSAYNKGRPEGSRPVTHLEPNLCKCKENEHAYEFSHANPGPNQKDSNMATVDPAPMQPFKNPKIESSLILCNFMYCMIGLSSNRKTQLYYS
ncbi:hypothetical protein R6Q59_012263 [Mikania micrantha]